MKVEAKREGRLRSVLVSATHVIWLSPHSRSSSISESLLDHDFVLVYATATTR